MNLLLTSPSWRITAQLRRYKRFFSRFHRIIILREPANPLFDQEWYLQHYDDVNFGATDPFGHYLRIGAKEGRDPNSLFDTSWYLEQNPDVVKDGINPLIHFYHHGAAEGRDPHPVFTLEWHRTRKSSGPDEESNPIIRYLRDLKKGPQT
jgi:hypothetical protein